MAAQPTAVILAAGGGTRLRPLTDNRPKCLLEVGGRTLLDYQLDALAANGVRDVLIVTGFCAEQVERHAAGRARTLLNPAFEATNNLYSLWVAAAEMSGRDFLCLHADVLFHPAILAPCLASPADVCAVLDRALVGETMKASVAGDQIIEIGKNLPADRMFGTFFGIARFGPRASAVLPEVLDNLVEKPLNRQAYFTACLPELAARGLRVGYCLTEGRPWIEIDSPADLDRAASEVLPKLPFQSAGG